MTAAIQVPLVWDHRPRACEVDDLAADFLSLESATAAAYKTAIDLDQRLEIARERLILATEEFGRTNGRLTLRGRQYALVVTPVNPPVLEIVSLGTLRVTHT